MFCLLYVYFHFFKNLWRFWARPLIDILFWWNTFSAASLYLHRLAFLTGCLHWVIWRKLQHTLYCTYIGYIFYSPAFLVCFATWGFALLAIYLQPKCYRFNNPEFFPFFFYHFSNTSSSSCALCLLVAEPGRSVMSARFRLPAGRSYNVRATELERDRQHTQVVCNVLLLDNTVQAFKVNVSNPVH